MNEQEVQTNNEETLGATCRGSYALGTACGECSKCKGKDFPDFSNQDIIVMENKSNLLDEELAEDSNLNPSQELFCQLYATHQEFFGNGVQSYVEAYNPDQTKPNWYKTACASASRLLRNVKVIDRINKILEETGMNDAFIDKQLSFLITQHSDFTAKLGAIKEYNKLRQRITDKVDHTSKGQQIGGFNFIMPEQPKPQLPELKIETPNEHYSSNNQTDIEASASVGGVSVRQLG